MFAEYDPQRIIKRVFGVDPTQFAPTVILAPTKRVVADLEAKLRTPQHFGTWFTGVSGYYEGEVLVTILNNIRYAPGMADCVYFLQFAGVKNLLYTGSIGGLWKEMAIGDIILVEEAERGDGASKYFAPIYKRAKANAELLNQAESFLQKAAQQKGSKLHIGKIFTTDSIAAETLAFLSSLQLGNYLGIEMETSALYTVASVVGIRAIAAHVVSDLPLQEKSLLDDFTDEEKENRDRAYSYTVNALMEFTRALAREDK